MVTSPFCKIPRLFLEFRAQLCYFLKVRVFKYPRFNRFAIKEGITDDELRDIVSHLEAGQADADLGAGVFKIRLARPGEGKSGGYRVIVYFKNEFRTFFVYGFPKSDRDNISKGELKAFKIDAKEDFALTDDQIKAWLERGTLIEILKEAEDEI